MEVQVPQTLLKPLVVPNKILMGPGPSNASPRVLHALSKPIIGHMHPEMFQIMDEIKEGLKYVFQTNNDLTLAISASGHGGMEAVLCNLLEPQDKVLIGVSGLWGDRAADIARRYGAQVSIISSPLGQSLSLTRLEREIKGLRPKVLFLAQGESSSGIHQPLKGLGDICHKYGTLLAVDTVASLGGVPFFMDKWSIDAVYTGSQKVLGAPAGLAPVSFSPLAQKAIFNRKTPVTVYYWDMTILGQQWNCFNTPRPYHHTTSSNLLCGLREGLALIANEGLENCLQRHQNCANRLHDGIRRLGLKLFVEEAACRLPTVTTIEVPNDLDWREVIAYAMKTYQLEISGGLGPSAGKVFRIGLMGYNATFENVDFVLKVFKEGLEFARSRKTSKL